MSRPRTVLHIAIQGEHAVATLTNGTTEQTRFNLTLDPLADDPQLVAEEWRETLRPHTRRTTRAIVSLPLNVLLSTTVPIPADLPVENEDSYLLLQAEKAFMLPPHDLALGMSRTRAGAVHSATIIGLEIGAYEKVRKTLRLLGIKHFQVTTPVYAPTAAAEAHLMVAADGIDLQVSAGGGIVLLRRLVGGLPGTQQPMPDVNALKRQLRITLTQLPADVREGLTRFYVCGRNQLIESVCAGMGIPAETTSAPPVITSGLPMELKPAAPPAARRWFSSWNRRKLATTAALGLVVIGVLAGLWMQQGQRLRQLEREWAELMPRAAMVRAILDDAKANEPWFTDDPECLLILRAVTQTFPESGTVWVTRLQIKNRASVSLSGRAVSRDAWLAMVDGLRASAGVADLRVGQVREASDGRTPMTFALTFTWEPSAERMEARR